MLDSHFPYVLPPLPYEYDALEPFIDAETMHYHHDKHFKTYIDNLNKALEPYPPLYKLSLFELLRRPSVIPERARATVLKNGGGVYNHSLFFQKLAPAGEGAHEPSGRLATMIDRHFGGFDAFREAFSQKALAVFGSGWTYLLLTPRGKLKIESFANQDTPVESGSVPVILFDVWEHAYYLKYKNLRQEYVDNIWNVVRFPEF